MCALTSGFSNSACAQALAKMDMKPSLIPCFATNCSWYFFLNSMMLLISTSLKVVSIAVLFFAETNLRAIVRRIRVIFSRCSLRLNKAFTGLGGTGVTGFSGAEGSVLSFDLLITADIASDFVILPSFPVPSTATGSTSPSRKILAAAGDGIDLTGSSFFVFSFVGAGASGTGVFTSIGFSVVGGCPLEDLTLVSILATKAPIARSSPSLATCINLPSASAGNSNVALSDSNSQIGSSLFTKLPSGLSHWDKVTSLMDSPITGTFISTTLMLIFSFGLQNYGF